jgi:hypothetical protein
VSSELHAIMACEFLAYGVQSGRDYTNVEGGIQAEDVAEEDI